MNLKLYIIIIIIIMVIIIRKMWLHAHSRPHRFHVAVAGPLHLAIFGRLWEERDKLLEMLNDFLYFLSLSLCFFLFYITVIFYTLSLSLSLSHLRTDFPREHRMSSGWRGEGGCTPTFPVVTVSRHHPLIQRLLTVQHPHLVHVTCGKW